MLMILRNLRRLYLILFRKDYVLKQLNTRKGHCLRHGCCDLSFFHKIISNSCLDKKDRTKCLLWEDLPYICKVYPIDEKDKHPDTKGYCGFYW